MTLIKNEHVHLSFFSTVLKQISPLSASLSIISFKVASSCSADLLIMPTHVSVGMLVLDQSLTWGLALRAGKFCKESKTTAPWEESQGNERWQAAKNYKFVLVLGTTSTDKGLSSCEVLAKVRQQRPNCQDSFFVKPHNFRMKTQFALKITRSLTFKKWMWSVRATFSRSILRFFSCAISCSSSAMNPSAHLSVCRCFSSMDTTSSAWVLWMERTSSANTCMLSSISLWVLACKSNDSNRWSALLQTGSCWSTPTLSKI